MIENKNAGDAINRTEAAEFYTGQVQPVQEGAAVQYGEQTEPYAGGQAQPVQPVQEGAAAQYGEQTEPYAGGQAQPVQPVQEGAAAQYGEQTEPYAGGQAQPVQPVQEGAAVQYGEQPQPYTGGQAQPIQPVQEGAAAQQTAPPAPKVSFKKKIPGYVEVLAAIFLAGMGIWMFYNTRGTRLLFVDVAFGRICKYYWIAFIGAAVFFAVGTYTLKRLRKEVKKNGRLE